MNSPYHNYGHLRSLLKPPWQHLRRWGTDPAYRALHRFARRLLNAPRQRPGAVRFNGRSIHFADGVSFLSAWDEIFVNRIYDINCDQPRPLLIDVGANIGLAALYWKYRLSRFRYIGFEADPRIARICRGNLTHWECDHELYQYAVTATGSSASFLSDGADGGRVINTSETSPAIAVPAVRLSTFLNHTVDLLKIDIEGAEFDVLEEAETKLGNVRRLFVEVHTRRAEQTRLGRLVDRLEKAGFRCFLQAIRAPAHPFIDPNFGRGWFDYQANIFAVRQ